MNTGPLSAAGTAAALVVAPLVIATGAAESPVREPGVRLPAGPGAQVKASTVEGNSSRTGASSVEAGLQRQEDTEAIRRLLREYGRTLDAGNLPAYAVFATGGEWIGACGHGVSITDSSGHSEIQSNHRARRL